MIRIFAIIAILIALCGVGCGGGGNVPAHADYLAHIETVRWNQSEVLYRVYGSYGDARRAVRRGFGRWEDAIGNRFVLREARDGETEQISARFAWIAPGLRDGRLEKMTPAYASPGVMASAVAEFDYQLTNPARLGDLERFAAHMMGHCLFSQGRATGGHSPYRSDLMYSRPGVARPSPADIKTFQLAFGGVR